MPRNGAGDVALVCVFEESDIYRVGGDAHRIVRARLNESLSLLAKIDTELPTIAAARSTLRRLSKSDPRLVDGISVNWD